MLLLLDAPGHLLFEGGFLLPQGSDPPLYCLAFFFQFPLLLGDPFLGLFELLQDFEDLFFPLPVQLLGVVDLLQDRLIFLVGLDFEDPRLRFFHLTDLFFQVLFFFPPLFLQFFQAFLVQAQLFLFPL